MVNDVTETRTAKCDLRQKLQTNKQTNKQTNVYWALAALDKIWITQTQHIHATVLKLLPVIFLAGRRYQRTVNKEVSGSKNNI